MMDRDESAGLRVVFKQWELIDPEEVPRAIRNRLALSGDPQPQLAENPVAEVTLARHDQRRVAVDCAPTTMQDLETTLFSQNLERRRLEFCRRSA